MKFTKMQGLGNDYLYVFGEVPENISELSIKLSDRHFGAGSDGMVYISKSDIADFKMRIFNADGSEAKMCGNGIRCVGKYLFDKGYTDKRKLNIETLSGIRVLTLNVKDGSVDSVAVEMGKATIGDKAECESNSYIPVSVGNPHAVIFCDDAEQMPIEKIGKAYQTADNFPNGVNVEFVSVLGKNKLRMRVWERGSGITMACGTGACATVAAAVSCGYCDKEETVQVVLDGGILSICVMDDGNVLMTGPAEFVFEGEVQC